MNRKKKAVALLSVVVVAAVISGIALNAYSAANASTQTTINGERSDKNVIWAVWPTGNISARMKGWSYGGMREHGYMRFIEVSDEFKENVTNIAKEDANVQNLLSEGYNIIEVRPIIKLWLRGMAPLFRKQPAPF